MNAGASTYAVPSPIKGSGTAWVLLGSWALSPARPTPIHPRHECRGLSALFGDQMRHVCLNCPTRWSLITRLRLKSPPAGRYVHSETDPLRKIHVLLEAGRHDATLGHEVGALIEATDFPVRDQQAEWIIYPELFMRAKCVHGIHSITSYNRTPNNHNFRSEPT